MPCKLALGPPARARQHSVDTPYAAWPEKRQHRRTRACTWANTHSADERRRGLGCLAGSRDREDADAPTLQTRRSRARDSRRPHASSAKRRAHPPTRPAVRFAREELRDCTRSNGVGSGRRQDRSGAAVPQSTSRLHPTASPSREGGGRGRGPWIRLRAGRASGGLRCLNLGPGRRGVVRRPEWALHPGHGGMASDVMGSICLT
jgi:hypothetical protein